MLYYDLGHGGQGFAHTTWAKQDMGVDAFLCCPGPSLKNVDTDILRGPGRKVFAINTAYPKVMPDVWMGLDTADCYDRNIWGEPFAKVLRGTYKDMEVDGKPVKWFDNVYFASMKEPEKGKSMLNYRDHRDHMVWHKNTLAAMLHLIIWMGGKNIHLIGCDMGGNSDYHDGRKLSKEQREYNRKLYRSQIQFIRKLSGLAKEQGINFISCTPDSPLNEFLQYKDLSTAIQEAEEKVKLPEKPIKHVLETRKPVMLHCNNYAGLGGIETTVIDIAKSMPYYQHVLASVRTENYDDQFLDHLSEQGIRHIFATPEKAAKMYNPKYIFLHNTHKFKEGVKDYITIGVHHGVMRPFSRCTYDWFVSQWVKDGYTGVDGNCVVMPPPVHPDELLKVKRPDRKPVVGRIQSDTWADRGKTNDDFYDMLKQLDGCGFFVVGKDVPKDIPQAPIAAGKMPEYLEKVDIFAIWGNTTESWSKVVTEANLSGIPVVARNHNDGLAEQLRNSGGGILVNTKQGFVEAIQSLIDDPEKRRDIALQGKIWALQHATTARFKEFFIDKIIGK